MLHTAKLIFFLLKLYSQIIIVLFNSTTRSELFISFVSFPFRIAALGHGPGSKEVESEQLAKAYTLLVIDSVKTLGITVDELFESTKDPIKFSNLGLTLLNHYRPITSQIGAISTASQVPDYISRKVAY